MEKQQRVLSLRNSKVMKKIESFQAFQESKQEEMIKKLQEADDRLENGLRRYGVVRYEALIAAGS